MARGLLGLEQVQRKVAPPLCMKLSSQFLYCFLMLYMVTTFSTCAQLESSAVHTYSLGIDLGMHFSTLLV